MRRESLLPWRPLLLVAAPASAAPMTLTIWTRLPQDVTAIFFENFHKLHPDIDVHVENIPGGKNHINKLMAAVTAGAPPDMTTLDVIGTAQFARIGALLPLDDLFANHPALAPDQFSPGQVETAMWDGKHYGLPFVGDVSVIYYNKDLFRAHGLDPDKPPRTWDEFTRGGEGAHHAAVALRVRDVPGLSDDDDLLLRCPISGWRAATVLDPKTNLYAFNSDAGVRALTFLSDLHLKDHVILPSAIGKTGDVDVLLDFLQKRVAMTFGGAAQLRQLQRQGCRVRGRRHAEPVACRRRAEHGRSRRRQCRDHGEDAEGQAARPRSR